MSDFNKIMSKLLAALIFFVATGSSFGQDFAFPKSTDYPIIESSGSIYMDFVPPNWRVAEKAWGDLNDDGNDDWAIVVKGNFGKFKQKNEGLGVEEFDTNPRIFIVLFAKGPDKGFSLAEQSNNFIITPESPTMSEPLHGLEIKKGVLIVRFEEFYSAGSWSMAERTYRFRHGRIGFQLIGADKTETMRNSGETETRSYNFLTGRMEISTGTISDDRKPKVRSKQFKLPKLETLRTVKPPMTWEIEKNYFL